MGDDATSPHLPHPPRGEEFSLQQKPDHGRVKMMTLSGMKCFREAQRQKKSLNFVVLPQLEAKSQEQDLGRLW